MSSITAASTQSESDNQETDKETMTSNTIDLAYVCLRKLSENLMQYQAPSTIICGTTGASVSDAYIHRW